MKISLNQAKSKSLIDIGEAIYDAHALSGGSWSDAASDVLADRIIERYQVHISAALGRAGIVLNEGETLDGATLLRVVNERAGVDIQAWTPEAVRVAFDGFMSRRLSESLGVEVQSVQDLAGVKQSLIDAAAAAVQSGRGNAFIGRGMIAKIRAAKAWKEGGVPVEDRRAVLSRWYQKKYRRSHKGVWRDA